jgi:mRNA-degrading endonuclease toxin of MazEF toxin-antitoxin module
MTDKRGDVVLALFPDSNLRTAKPRPVLVVQADNLRTILETHLDRVLGVWTDMSAVDDALRHTLHL